MSKLRLLLGLALLAALIEAAAPTVPAAAGRCGVERWPIKTLSDRDADAVDRDPVHTTVTRLRRKDRPDVHEDSRRLAPVEVTTWRIKARLRFMALEDDRDIHLVVTAPKHTGRMMIVEFPDVRCPGARSSPRKGAMRRARNRFERACGEPSSGFSSLHGTAIIKGVGFWDFDHGQTGVAPQAIELHPVVGIRVRSC
jgi:hypothetical protein